MRIGLIIIAITTFLVVNTYYDGKYTKLFHINKKYIQMATYGFVGLSLYLFVKRNPEGSKSIFKHANDIVRYMPIDRNTTDMLTPIFNFANNSGSVDKMSEEYIQNSSIAPQMKRMMNSGGKSSKRCVSETKKKFIASQQGWKCNSCNEQLQAWFEVDHKIRLDSGGTNNIDNLVALCRNCHGKKTALENMGI